MAHRLLARLLHRFLPHGADAAAIRLVTRSLTKGFPVDYFLPLLLCPEARHRTFSSRSLSILARPGTATGPSFSANSKAASRMAPSALASPASLSAVVRLAGSAVCASANSALVRLSLPARVSS